MRERLAGLWSRTEPHILLAGLAAAGALWGFVELSELAMAAQPHELDARILLAFRTAGDAADPIGPPWVEEAMRDVTALGSVALLVSIVTAAFMYLVLARRPGTALFLLGSVAGGQVLSSLLKATVDRPRPDLVSHLAQVQTLSFPSGHAMLSAITYLTLGALLARTTDSRTMKAYILGLAVLTTLAVGISRVYLGVHWPSDVLAGWCAGFAWATTCWLGARLVLSRRRPVA